MTFTEFSGLIALCLLIY
ncbi:putative membrane protein, partial [Vibrio cholerae HC-17A1]